jgi:alpha-L-fucosidase
MVFELQPDIIVNNRNRLDGDFATPEQRIEAAKGKSWEACMTMNDSWGYHKNDDDWKSPKTVVRNLITCARQGGNYLINIGPKADGSIPEESVRIMSTVGQWMDKSGSALYGAEPCSVSRSNYCSFTRKGNTLFVHAYFWPGEVLAISGLLPKVKSAKFLVGNKPVKFVQDDFRVRLMGLPLNPPDNPVTTFALECESEPKQDTNRVRIEKPRGSV